MASSQTMTGARAKLSIFDPASGQARVLGIFNNVSFGLTYDVQPAYILGRFSAAETAFTSQDLVTVNASGFRIPGAGPHIEGGIPALQNLLTHEYLELLITDRLSEVQGGEPRVARIEQVRPVSYSSSYAARQLSDLSVTFVGILVSDESVDNAEDSTAADLP